MVVSIQDVYKVLLLNVQYIKQISTFLIKPKSCQLPVPGMRNLKQKSLRTQVNYSKIGIDKNQLSVMSRENSRTFPKRGTALVTLNKVGEILYLTIYTLNEYNVQNKC